MTPKVRSQNWIYVLQEKLPCQGPVPVRLLSLPGLPDLAGVAGFLSPLRLLRYLAPRRRLLLPRPPRSLRIPRAGPLTAIRELNKFKDRRSRKFPITLPLPSKSLSILFVLLSYRVDSPMQLFLLSPLGVKRRLVRLHFEQSFFHIDRRDSPLPGCNHHLIVSGKRPHNV